jgi:hypothetical protein
VLASILWKNLRISLAASPESQPGISRRALWAPKMPDVPGSFWSSSKIESKNSRSVSRGREVKKCSWEPRAIARRSSGPAIRGGPKKVVVFEEADKHGGEHPADGGLGDAVGAPFFEGGGGALRGPGPVVFGAEAGADLGDVGA